jgi:hypothetical protein
MAPVENITSPSRSTCRKRRLGMGGKEDGRRWSWCLYLARSRALFTGLSNAYLKSLVSPPYSNRVDAQLLEPPCTDPYAQWCGRGGVARLPPSWPSTSTRCDASIFPESEVDRTRHGRGENGAHDLSGNSRQPQESSVPRLRCLRGTLVADMYYLRSCALKCRRPALRLQATSRDAWWKKTGPPRSGTTKKANAVKFQACCACHLNRTAAPI